jgi:hypothetical protein
MSYAFGTLLVLGSLDKCDELLVIFVKDSTNIELFARHTLMILHFTLQTVHLRTNWAGKLRVALVEVKYILATS